MSFATETAFTGADAVEAQPPLTPAELAPHFPQLEIIECLGRGGMGVVYKARQKSLNRIVALKLLAPERAADTQFAQRFSHEAQALAALNHPSIVTVYDFGQAGGFYFLLMEFVDGVNLRQAMKAGRFTPEQALAVVPPVCAALQYAHEHGVVHRDIKPENLLLDREGRAKIADFGVAKLLHADVSEVGLAESQAAGTPQYMAPEQKAHRTTDHRADIYSLGVVLYELLTGELPADKLQPPSRKVQIDVRLDEIVLRALENSPELRFQTAGEMRTQVETVVSTPASGSGHKAEDSSGPARFLKVCASTLTTPAEIATYRGQFSLGRSRGQLILDDRQLTHSRAGKNTVMPLSAIRDVSIGQYPRSMNPAGIDLLSITYEEGGERKQVLLSPMESWFGFPSTWNARIAEWATAIREAVTAAAGGTPTTTPASQLGVPRGWIGLPILLAVIPVLLGAGLIPFLLTRTPGGGPFLGGLGSIAAAAFIVGSFSFLILSRSTAVWSTPGARRRLALRAGGLILILAGLALGWTQMRVGRSAHAQRLAMLSARIPQLQHAWQLSQQHDYETRRLLSDFEARHRTVPEFNRQPVEMQRTQYNARLQEIGSRSAALLAEIQTTSDQINRLHFPDSRTAARTAVLAVPFLLGGVLLLFWPGSAPSSSPVSASRSGWRRLGVAGIVLGLTLLLGASLVALRPRRATVAAPQASREVVPIETETGGAEAGKKGRVEKFEALDLDKDGVLSFDEFAVTRKPREAEKWFRLRDADKDGFLSSEEFLPFSAKPRTQ